MWMRLVCTPVSRFTMKQKRQNCRLCPLPSWIKPFFFTLFNTSLDPTPPPSPLPSISFLSLERVKLKRSRSRWGNSGWTPSPLPVVIDPNSTPRRVHSVYKPQPRNDISPISARCFALEYGLDVLPTIYAPRIFGTFGYSGGIKCFVWFI